jgi:glycolate oxidase iron-sulfur subunit
VHAGEEEQAVQLARQTIDAFENAQADAVIVNAAGCGSNVKEYGHLLRDDPQYAGRAKAFAAKCCDVSEFLAELEPRATRYALRLRVAYHDACHLLHAQGVRTQPRALLERIPQLQLLEIPEAATKLGDRKAGHVAALDANMVVSGNPGCLLQLQSALPRVGGENCRFATSSSCSRVYQRSFPCDGGALPALLGSLLRF